MINCTRLLNAPEALPGPRYMPGKAPIVFWFAAGYPGCGDHGVGQKLPDDTLTREEAAAFLEELVSLGVPMLTVEGDNLSLREDIFQLVEPVARKGLRVIFATGHHWVDGEAVARIKGAGVSYVGINLDLPGEGERLKECFECSLPSVKALQEYGMPFGIKVSFSSFNRADVAATLAAMKEAGVKRVAFYQSIPAGAEWRQIQRDRQDLMDLLLEEVAASAESGTGLEIVTEDNYADGPYTVIWSKRNGKGGAAQIRRLLDMQGGCGAGRKILGVSASGDVHPCPSWWHLAVGNVRQTPLGDIWAGGGEGLFQALRERKGHLKGRCGSCGFQAICGGCRVRAHRAHGDHFQEDPACYVYNEAQPRGQAVGLSG